MNTLPRPARSWWRRDVAVDILTLTALLVLAFFWWISGTPEFAANLPQDAVDFAVPAANFAGRGRLVHDLYGQEHPPAHPPGLPLMLAPAYAIFGPMLGNGIYVIQFCAAAAIVFVYGTGRRLGSRRLAILASLFLIFHYGFWQYSQKIMSEVPTAAMSAGLLWLLLLRDHQPLRWPVAMLLGGLVGWAVWIRYDNLLLGVSLLAVVLAQRPFPPSRSWLVAMGAAALLGLTLATYQHTTFGRPWRTGYHYWGNAGRELPLLAAHNLRTTDYLKARGMPPDYAGVVEGNAHFYAVGLAAQFDTSHVFGHPAHWSGVDRPVYQSLAGIRTGLGLLGLMVALWMAWRSKPMWTVAVWTLSTVAACGLFYAFYFWQEERFFIKAVPAVAILNAVGADWLLTRAARYGKLASATGLVGVAVLLGGLGLYCWQQGFPSGERTYTYPALSEASRQMESDAIVVSNFGAIRSEALLVRGTSRVGIPLNNYFPAICYPETDNSPVRLEPFQAGAEPEKLAELARSGRPVYLVVENPWTGQPLPELAVFERYFRVYGVAFTIAKDGRELPYLMRLKLKLPS